LIHEGHLGLPAQTTNEGRPDRHLPEKYLLKKEGLNMEPKRAGFRRA
jgi:hypothetical protein